jgi:hypothetical protein
MVTFVILGLVAVIGFLCLSDSVLTLARRDSSGSRR